MTLTEGQNQAISAIYNLKNTRPNGGGILVINGPAGSGKSTLTRTLAESDNGLLVLAPTGKAATRVRDIAGCRVSTIHKWLYKASEDKFGDVVFERADLIDIEKPDFHCIIVDEASMVSESIWDDMYDAACLLGLSVVLIGDSFQLPPVETSGSGFSVFSPEFPCDMRIDLTEILRQALDSPILRAANAIRIGLDYTRHLSALPLVMKDDVLATCINTFKNDGVILCHTNETRHLINNGMRESNGTTSLLEEKEPVLVIKNNYELDIFNGEILGVNKIIEKLGSKIVKDKFKHTSCFVDFVLVELQNKTRAVVALQQLANKTGEMGFKPLERESKKLAKKSGYEDMPFLHTNYGYVLSCHKSQGSEFDSGLVLIEKTVRATTISGRRWVYTALTRFKKNVQICWY